MAERASGILPEGSREGADSRGIYLEDVKEGRGSAGANQIDEVADLNCLAGSGSWHELAWIAISILLAQVTVPEIFLHFEAAATYSVGRIVHRYT